MGQLARSVVTLTRMSEPPLRLVIGADAYSVIDLALQDRLRVLTESGMSSETVVPGSQAVRT
jgi:hypothetical protein